ncbi:MAG: Tripartite ATP-independent periplasmic transporter [Syntrophorhabdus sp. PtaU1.Bin058]|nr:MAG: Tripartite ATP-independent periplasmic transporter [Syntrophorhabdus sp. PtaU1.Bin058]
MKTIFAIVLNISKFLNSISGIALIAIMVLTTADVVLRIFKQPIIGTYEIVGLLGAIVIGFGIPMTSWIRGHIFVDFIIEQFPEGRKNVVNIFTRLLGVGLFFVAGWNLIIVGMDLYRTGEVSLTRQLPFYPIAHGLAVSCFVQCLVLICDIIKIFAGEFGGES